MKKNNQIASRTQDQPHQPFLIVKKLRKNRCRLQLPDNQFNIAASVSSANYNMPITNHTTFPFIHSNSRANPNLLAHLNQSTPSSLEPSPLRGEGRVRGETPK